MSRKSLGLFSGFILTVGVLLSAWICDYMTKNKERDVYGSMLAMAVYFSGDQSEARRGDSVESVIARINKGREPPLQFVRSHDSPFPDLLPVWNYDFADSYYGSDGPLAVAFFSYWLQPDKALVIRWNGRVTTEPSRQWEKNVP